MTNHIYDNNDIKIKIGRNSNKKTQVRMIDWYSRFKITHRPIKYLTYYYLSRQSLSIIVGAEVIFT